MKDVCEPPALRTETVVRVVEGFRSRASARCAGAVVVNADEHVRVDGVRVTRPTPDVLLEVCEAGLVPHRRIRAERLHVITRRLLPFGKPGLTHAGRAIEIPRRPHLCSRRGQCCAQQRDHVVVHEILDDPVPVAALEHVGAAVEIIAVTRTDRDAPIGERLRPRDRIGRRHTSRAPDRRRFRFSQQTVQRRSLDLCEHLKRRQVRPQHFAHREVDAARRLLELERARLRREQFAAEIQCQSLSRQLGIQHAHVAAGQRRLRGATRLTCQRRPHRFIERRRPRLRTRGPSRQHDQHEAHYESRRGAGFHRLRLVRWRER